MNRARVDYEAERPAVCGSDATFSAVSFAEHVEHVARALDHARPRTRVLGLLADNGPDWLALDLAAQRTGVVLVPLPPFFTLDQLRHVVTATGMDALVVAQANVADALGFRRVGSLSATSLGWFRRAGDGVRLPARTAKITFTSGTTGAPKGVCLSAAGQHGVATGIAQATKTLRLARHLSVLPCSVLLENVAGGYAPMLVGATCCVPPLVEVGVVGSSGFDPVACLAALERWRAQSAILLPEMMTALTAAIEAGAPRPSRLRFAAVGGARIASEQIERARAAGLSVYEGYGLSECGSVVTLNVPGADRPGSVGRALPHVDVKIADDGEILVARAGFLGYVGAEGESAVDGWLRTGDLGRIDADGFLYVDGRRKHVLITSFGRNVAPEWPEAVLRSHASIAQAAVFGDARPNLCAVIVPRASGLADDAIDTDVRRANDVLPDYARIGFWLRADAAFLASNGLATANGRVRRDAVWSRYGQRLDARYESTTGPADHVVL